MIKQAPSPARIAAMVAFSFSCVGILLLLWLQFGGAVPLRAEGYRVKVAFPEAVGIAKDIDVRISGINVGTVRNVEVDHRTSRALATIVLDSEYAPLAGDARAILRRKTLLGESFVEITSGSRRAKPVPDGGRLPDGQVAATVELDEIFQSYDPQTRRAFQLWQAELDRGVRRRGEDLNNAVGQLPEFTQSGIDLLSVLNRHEAEVRGLVRDTGEVYSALTQDERQLSNLIRNSHAVFSQTADARESLAEAFHIFPTFLTESKTTLERLERFSRNARPLVRDLRPVAKELRPTLVAVRKFAPDLRHFFRAFRVQIRESRTALPALRETLDETRPLFRSLGPFLQELNPIFQWLEANQQLFGDFLGYAAGGLADTTPSAAPGETGHYLRQLGVQGVESAGIHRSRVSSNRGNSYLPPIFPARQMAKFLVQPSWDCKPSGGPTPSKPPPAGSSTGSTVGCFVDPNVLFKGDRSKRFTHIERENYRGR